MFVIGRGRYARATYPISSSASSGNGTFSLSDIYIDATNGDDNRDGTSPATAWKTNARIQKTIGLYGFVQPSTGNILTIRYVGTTSPPQDDPFDFLVVLGPDVEVHRDFSGISGQIVHTGSLTAVRQINHVTNTAPGMTDAAIPNWTPYIGKRVRVTSGAALGATFGVLAAETPTLAETSIPVITNGLNESVSYPAPLDTYVIEELPSDWQGAIDIKVRGNDNFSAVLVHFGGTIEANSSLSTTGMALVFFKQCVFREQELVSLGGNREYAACVFQQGFFYSAAGPCQIKACGIIGVCAVANDAVLTVHTLADTIVEGGGFLAINGGRIIIDGNAGSFNATAAGLNPLGDGFTSDKDGFAGAGHIEQVGGGGTVYGKGNAGVGWRVGHGQTDTADVRPTVTGTGGDFALVSGTTCFAFDPVAATYVAPAKNCTWANMNLAAQLNGQAHAPGPNTHLVTVPGS